MIINTMHTRKIFILPFLLLTLLVFGFTSTEKKPKPSPKKAEIVWVSLQQAEQLAKKDNKKILIDFYTDWCGFCKKMDRSTYQDEKVVAYINEHYHAVKFDGESKEDLTFGGNTYKAGERFHDFAVMLLGGNMLFPTTAILGADLKGIMKFEGFREAKEMHAIIQYFEEELHKKKVNLQQYIDERKKS